MATINAVAKKSVKVFGNILPIGSVGLNIWEAHKMYPNDLGNAGRVLLLRYTGFDMKTGQFHGNEISRGLGTLAVSLAAREIIKAVA